MKLLAQIAVIALLAAAAAAVTYGVKGPPNRLFQCDPATLKSDEICLQSLTDETGLVWVDARPRKDWLKSGMPGSMLWNLDSNEDMQAFEAEAAARMLDATRVVVYCGDENCGISRQVADRIRNLGFGPEVVVLRGGWRALKDAGRVKAE